MRKVIILLLSILSLNLNAQEMIDTNKLEYFNQKHFEVEYTQEGAIDKETGYLRVNNSEYFKSKHQEVKEIAMDYLQKKLQLYGLTDLTEFRLRKVAESLTGEFVYFNQYINDIPVYLTNFTIFVDKEKLVRFVSNEFRNISKARKDALALSSNKHIEMNEAIDIAKKYLNILEKSQIIGDYEPGGWLTYFESKDKGMLLTWAVNINCYKPSGNWYIFVDAIDKEIIYVEDMMDNADVPSLVYNPNPLVTKQVSYGGSYVGGSGTNALLDAAREQVILRDVIYNNTWDVNNPFYQIWGPYCDFKEYEDPKTTNGVTVYGNPSVIDFKRNQREFATIMCYYHIDKSARRLIELGYYIDNTGLKGFVVDPHAE